MSEDNLTPTRRSVLKATGAAIVGTTMSGVATAMTNPGDVTATMESFRSSFNFDNSKITHARVRVYQADTATMSQIESVKDDVFDLLSNYSTLDGYRVEAYSTNVTGLETCMNTSGCDPYQHCRDYVVELGHHQYGGGNLFIHDGSGGGTYGGVNNDNYITMDHYNTPDKGPISIKTPKTLTGKDGDVHWHAAHEVAHQLHGNPDNWDHDYGTYFCGSDSGRKPHYLTTVRSDNRVTVMSAPGRGGQWNCGDCENTYSADYASLYPSSCNEFAVDDAIVHASTL